MYNIIYTFIFLSLCSCNSESAGKTYVEKIGTNNSAPTVIKVNDTTYLPYIIDTTKSFSDLKEMLEYKNKNFTDFRAFARKLESTSKTPNTVKFLNDSVSYLNEGLFNFIMKKYIVSAEKNIITLRCLGTILDYPSISDDEKLSLFNSFPENLRKGVEGNKMLLKLNEYNTNVGSNFQDFDSEKLLTINAKVVNLKSVFNSSYEYHILLFGASWCKPCRYGDLLLKNRISSIDTSKFKFINISMDQDFVKWTKSYFEDSPVWDCYLLENNFHSRIVQKLQIPGVPRIFLIDSNYQIIAEHFDLEFILNKISILNGN